MAHANHRPDTPADALAELLSGNGRFVTDTRLLPHQDAARRREIAAAQNPFAVVFGCSDSRLTPEIIFDRGLGDLFVVRTAGHIIGPGVLASIEYGVTVLGACLVVVLGHESCGAIQATTDALTGTQPPARNLRAIIDRVTPSIRQAHIHHVTNHDEIATVHVRRTVDLLIRATGIATAVATGRCALVGMAYRLTDGRATPVTTVYGALPPDLTGDAPIATTS